MTALSPLYAPPGEATRACWTGRVDGAAPEVARWHQVVQTIDLRKTLEHCFDPTICLIG